LVEYFRVYPVLAQIITSTVVILFSYLAQRHFSFRSQVVKD
jgi:putative flippase GtrA